MTDFNSQPNGNDNQGGNNQPPTQDQALCEQSINQDLTPIIALVPLAEFRRLGVVPVYYDRTGRRLKLIYSATSNENCRRELSARLSDVELEWHPVEESVLDVMHQEIVSEYLDLATPAVNASIEKPHVPYDAKPYPGQQTTAAERPTPVVSEAASETRREPIIPPGQKTVLFVTPTGNISQHLMFALNAEHCETVTARSLPQAVEELEKRPVAGIFIHENLYRRGDQFLQRMETIRPETPIRYYRSDASLLLNDTRNQTIFDLVRQNLTLFSRLNDSQGSVVADHAATVARFADRVAIHLEIPTHCRLMIATAAFLHNMAEVNLNCTAGLQPTDIIGLSASRLESWGFPPLVVRMLRRMYRPVDDSEPTPGGIEATGGYILTAADVLCHLWPDCSGAGRQMDLIQKKLEDQLRGKVPPSVIGTLVDVVCDDCTARLLRQDAFSVHFFEARGSRPTALIDALRDSDFGVTFSSTIDECVKRCGDLKADLLIIRDSGSVPDVYDTLMSLALRGLAINQLHTVLLLDAEAVTEALRLLPHGVEEVLAVTAPHQAVITKLTRIRSRLEEQFRHRVSAIERLGTHGSLGDMGLADILESLRGNQRPARVSVTAFGNQLTVYIDRGTVIAADCGESRGADALLKGVSWRQGIWNIESIETSELPAPNVEMSIDAVLIEACTKLDQVVKDEPIYV